MKILIAVDFSPVGREVAHHGYRIALNSGKDAMFFHSVPQTARLLAGYDMNMILTEAEKRNRQEIKTAATSKLDKVVEDVLAESGKKDSTKIDEYVASGEAAEEIIKYVKAHDDIDLIIVGYKSYSAIEEILVGSTAAKVARYAPCSVLIYRPDKEEKDALKI